MSKPWMTSEIQRLKELWHTMLDDDASAMIGRSKSACKAVAKRLKETDHAFAAALAEREDAYRETVLAHQSEIKIALDR